MSNASTARIRRAGASSGSPDVLTRELAAALDDAGAACTMVFASPDLDREVLANAFRAHLRADRVIGCTTAGEIGPGGLGAGGLVGFTLPASDFRVVHACIPNVRALRFADGEALVRELRDRLAAGGVTPTGRNTFAVLLIDGLSAREEVVVSATSSALRDIPLAGGSAGDGLRFHEAAVYADGAFRSGSAVVALVQTDRPFVPLKIEHFVPGAVKMVVTEADPSQRIVREINGEPAAEEYARLVGLEPGHLTAMAFATHPVVVQVGGRTYVRSIQKVNDDGSLTFFCAIDEGVVLTLGESAGFVESLATGMAAIDRQIGPPELVIGFDCILRRLEVERCDLEAPISQLFADHRVIGFSTYGEQFNAMHVNQTFTGIAIGAQPAPR